MGRIGWWLLAFITAAFIALAAAVVRDPDKWNGVALLGLTALYVGAMLVVGVVAFVITALVRSRRAANKAQQAAADV